METVNTTFTEVEDKDKTTTTIDAETGAQIPNGFQKSFENKQEAETVMMVLDQCGLGDHYDYTASKSGTVITISDVTQADIELLQRKINIATWSNRTILVANAITNFATDVADYALNGAVAPTAVAVTNAALTTGRVVGTAAVKVGAGVVTSLARNTRAAAVELSNSKEIKECGTELRACWEGISGKLFGSSGTSSNTWTAI